MAHRALSKQELFVTTGGLHNVENGGRGSCSGAGHRDHCPAHRDARDRAGLGGDGAGLGGEHEVAWRG